MDILNHLDNNLVVESFYDQKWNNPKNTGKNNKNSLTYYLKDFNNTYNEKFKNIEELCKNFDISRSLLYYRVIKKRMNFDDALTMPIKQKINKKL